MKITGQKIAVLGGDCRQFYLARHLYKSGFDVSMYGFSPNIAGIHDDMAEFAVFPHFPRELKTGFAKFGIFVLPLPMSSDNLRLNAPFATDGECSELRLLKLFNNLPSTVSVFAGRVSNEMTILAESKNISITDYFLREELQIRNAVPTAEGAVEIIIRELPVTVSGLECAVAGYGRVGCVTARLLKAMGAHVIVFARSAKDRARAMNDGMTAYHTDIIADNTSFRVLLNTVPAEIIAKRELERMRPDVLLIDLAASPGGINAVDAKSTKRHVIWALSLPGKTSPQSAGEIIADTVRDIIVKLPEIKGG